MHINVYGQDERHTHIISKSLCHQIKIFIYFKGKIILKKLAKWRYMLYSAMLLVRFSISTANLNDDDGKKKLFRCSFRVWNSFLRKWHPIAWMTLSFFVIKYINHGQQNLSPFRVGSNLFTELSTCTLDNSYLILNIANCKR